MGRPGAEVVITHLNLISLAVLSGQSIGHVHAGHPPRTTVLKMECSVSLTHGKEAGALGVLRNSKVQLPGREPMLQAKAALVTLRRLIDRLAIRGLV